MDIAELEQLASQINAAVVQLSYRWKIFCQLYDSGSDSIGVLNRRGSNVFQLLQRLMIDDAIMTLARLTDPGKIGGRDNASISRLVDESARFLERDVGARHRERIEQIMQEVQTIRTHRNRALAHADLQTVIEPNQLPPLTYDELERAMESCRAIMRDITLDLFRWTTHFEVIIPYGCDGTTLIETLRVGNDLRDHDA